MLSIRPLTDADLEPLRLIVNAIIARGDAFAYDEPFTPSAMRQYVDGYAAGGQVATLDGRVVGGYVLRPNQPGRGKHVCNATYFVDESIRGRGIGRRLGEHSLARARELGFTAMQFNAVVATNQAAVRLWTGLGFHVAATLPGAFRQDDGQFVDLLVMHRAL